jgi:hypothetical protein
LAAYDGVPSKLLATLHKDAEVRCIRFVGADINDPKIAVKWKTQQSLPYQHYGHLSWRAGGLDRRFGGPIHAAAGDIRPPVWRVALCRDHRWFGVVRVVDGLWVMGIRRTINN